MVLDKHRKRSDEILRPVAKQFIGINPDTLSLIAILFAVLAMVSFFLSQELVSSSLSGDGNFLDGLGIISPYWLLFASAFIALNGFFDMMDGQVAKMTGKASKRGDFLDHVLDRYADIFILIGVIISGYTHFYIGLFGLIGVFMTSYMGTQSQALGVKRDYGGVLGRADRLALLILIPVLLFIHIQYFNGPVLPWISDFFVDLTLFDILMLWFGIAGNVTAVQRGVRTWRALSKNK